MIGYYLIVTGKFMSISYEFIVAIHAKGVTR